MTEEKKHRLNLSLTDSVKKRIDRMVKKTESVNMTQTIREALFFYEEAIDIVAKGGKVQFVSPEGETVAMKIHLAPKNNN